MPAPHTLAYSVYAGQQILDLLLVEVCPKPGILLRPEHDDFAYALVVGGQATLSDRYCFLKMPLKPGRFLAAGRVGLVQ